MTSEDIVRYQFSSLQSRSEAAENGRKGGIASGVARRRKKSIKEAADYYLSLPVADNELKERITKLGVDADDVDNQMAVIVGLTMKAINGDSKAAKVLAEFIGEGKSQLEVSGPDGAPLMEMDMSTLTDDQLRVLAAQSQKEENDE